jgi:hypothetical protein
VCKSYYLHYQAATTRYILLISMSHVKGCAKQMYFSAWPIYQNPFGECT